MGVFNGEIRPHNTNMRKETTNIERDHKSYIHNHYKPWMCFPGNEARRQKKKIALLNEKYYLLSTYDICFLYLHINTFTRLPGQTNGIKDKNIIIYETRTQRKVCWSIRGRSLRQPKFVNSYISLINA